MTCKIKTSILLSLLPYLLPVSAQNPAQPGIAEDCDTYHLVVLGDQCGTIEAQYGITHAQFRAWNPAINDSCSNLWLDYYVCVNVPETPTTTSTTTSTSTSTTSGPEPQLPGTIEGCKDFVRVEAGNSCWSLAQLAGITTAQFREWNTGINAGCTNLWADYFVCVGV